MDAGYCPLPYVISLPPILAVSCVASNRADCIKSIHASHSLKVRDAFHILWENNLRDNMINPLSISVVGIFQFFF